MFSSFKIVKNALYAESIVKIRNLNHVYLSQSTNFVWQNRLNKSLESTIRHNRHNFRIAATINIIKRDLAQKNFQSNKTTISHKNGVWYILSGTVLFLGLAYAGVPLFKIFCESQGIEANVDFRDVNFENLKDKLIKMKKDETRPIKVKFVASTSADLLWNFKPCQEEITLVPGETALAFFRAKNLTDKSIVGISTYSILPFEAGQYFNKIQCFCFEEQRLDPHEEIDMPVFFYIDEQYSRDPKLELNDEICLSYCFFESKGSEDLQNIQKLAARTT